MGRTDRFDDLTFRVNFSGDGAAKLRHRVREKLKEFMGDYTDDTLVEYVIVLLKNGRSKQQAENELNVFLGNDSDSFVSWLWDHLGSNLDLYVEPGEICLSNKKPVSEEKDVKNGYHKLDSEPERENNNLPKNRHNREWNGLVRSADGPPLLRSVVTTNVPMEEEKCHKVGYAKNSPPQLVNQRKRTWSDDHKAIQRETLPKATLDASRRLLQFAVRDAVSPSSKPSSATPEPLLKRLRSVVSTSTGEIIQSVVREPTSLPDTVKSTDEPSKCVVKIRSSRNVFDRLGRSIDLEEEVASVGVREYENNIRQRGYDIRNTLGRRVLDISQTVPSGQSKVDNSMMVQYGVANNAEVIERRELKDKRQLATPNVSSVKQAQCRDPRKVRDLYIQNFAHESGPGAGRSDGSPMKEARNSVTVGNGNAIPEADDLKEPHETVASNPGLHSVGRPIEDTDSRTIFVSNVHFAATKDSLSRHFNKFGDVLKVVILTDAATGQPKGSAYVEFTRKEAAEFALSLDGTSFMSRILKVVEKSSAPQEAAQSKPWPHTTRGSPFMASRFSWAPYPRGIPSIYKPRLPMKVGTRSMQWKRDDTQTTSTDNSVPSPTARSLTYVRTESKINTKSVNV